MAYKPKYDTKFLPNLNSDDYFCRDGQNGREREKNGLEPYPSSTALCVDVEMLCGDDIPYEYSDQFLKLCDKCLAGKDPQNPKQAICTNKIETINDFRHYRIREARGKFRFIPKNMRPAKREDLPKIFSFKSPIDGTKQDGFDAGHIVAFFLGGMDCPFNLVMMDSYHNQKGYYRLMELYCQSYFSRLNPNIINPVKGYATGMITVTLRYNNKESPMVPTHFMVKVELHMAGKDSNGKMNSVDDHFSFNFSNPGSNGPRSRDFYEQMKIKRKQLIKDRRAIRHSLRKTFP